MARDPAIRFARCMALARSLANHTERGAAHLLYSSERGAAIGLSHRSLADEWRVAVRGKPDARHRFPTNFYVHVPFCASRCAYCTNHTRSGASRADVLDYLARLRTEMTFYRTVFGRTVFDNLYIGGGTPSFLELRDLRSLVEMLRSNFSFRDGGDRSFECNPDSIDRAKARLLRDHGFNRASLGVQTFNRRALRAVNRGYQTLHTVLGAIGVLRDEGFRVNIDLILGLPGDDRDTFLALLEKGLAAGPDEVTMNPLIPETPVAVLRDAGAWGRWSPALRSAVRRMAERAGYVVGPRQFELKLVRRSASTRDERPRTREGGGDAGYGFAYPMPSSLFGMGPASRSYIRGRLSYKMRPWTESPAGDEDAVVAWGRRLSRKREMRRYATVHLTRTPPLESSEFLRLFGVPVERALRAEFDGLSSLGLLRRTPAGYRLAASGRRGSFATALFIAEDAALDQLEDWTSRKVVGARPVDESPPTCEHLMARRMDAERRLVLGKLMRRVKAALGSDVLRPLRSAGWSSRIALEPPYVLIELRQGGALPLRVGVAPAGTSPSCYERLGNMEVSFLTPDGRDIEVDPEARRLFERIVDGLRRA
jgi:oxygen-independent coproporphyrinogen-3 oxidase